LGKAVFISGKMFSTLGQLGETNQSRRKFTDNEVKSSRRRAPKNPQVAKERRYESRAAAST